MSNYYGVVRTNYFHVRDEEQFRSLMSKASGDSDSIALWDDLKDSEGKRLFGFGVYGTINGVPNDDNKYDDDSCDRFIDGLKECVAEDDAILIFEAGHEKLRYVGGGVTIITAKSIEYIDLENSAIRKAQELLRNDHWNTRSSC